MDRKRAAVEIRVKHCQKCVNNCALDAPRCQTGERLAACGDIYETVTIEKQGLLKRLSGRNLNR